MPLWFQVYVKNSHTSNPLPKGRHNSTASLGADQIAYTAKQAALALGGISVRSLTRLEERGRLKSCKALRHKLYSRSELERFLEENS